MLRSPANSIPIVMERLQPEQFRTDCNQTLCRAIYEICKTTTPDLVILADYLHRTGKLEDVGGYPSIAKLWESPAIVGNLPVYVQIVRDAYAMRQMRLNAALVLESIDNPNGTVAEIVDQIASITNGAIENYQHSGVQTLESSIDQLFDQIDQKTNPNTASSASRGVRTGFARLDNLMGGLHPSELTIIGARTSVGKTAVALCMLQHIVAVERVPLYFASLEMGKSELVQRLLCAEGEINGKRIRNNQLTMDDNQRMIDAAIIYRWANTYIDDSPDQTIERIVSNARRYVKHHGARLVIVDYLQLIRSNRKNTREARHEIVGQMSWAFKTLARDLKVPVVVLSQVNRASETQKDKRPALSNLRESGSIEQDADNVLLLHRPGKGEKGVPDSMLEIIVAKQRNGPLGTVLTGIIHRHQIYCEYGIVRDHFHV